MKVAVVAIAKNEEKYIKEWIAYHLSIGFDSIRVYCNDCEDNTENFVKHAGMKFAVEAIHWPSKDLKSPQRSAYNHSLKDFSDFDWVCFIDIDEFIVPYDYGSIKDYLSLAGEDISAIGINWRIFGSSQITDANYRSVIKTFRYASLPNFNFNNHIKTIVRPNDVEEMFIHHAAVKRGLMVNSAFEPLVFMEPGRMELPVFNGIQINHYQSKTREEFFKRRSQGNANFNPTHSHHERVADEKKFKYIDKNNVIDENIDKFVDDYDRLLDEIG